MQFKKSFQPVISLCRDCLRVTIGTRPENDMLLEALKNYEC